MTDQLRVCLLNDSFPPLIDGVANTVVNYAETLTRLGDQVVVTTPSYPGAEDNYPYPVIRYPSLPTTRLVGYRAGYPFSATLLSALEDFRPDLIHSHCPFMSTMVARTLRERVDVPMIFTYHTKFDIEIRRAVRSELLQARAAQLVVGNIAACDEVWVVSQGAGENLRSLGYEGDMVVMENGVDFPKGRASQDQIDAILRELQIPKEHPVYLFVGRLRWYKGIREILDGLAGLKRDGKSFTMVFVGQGEDQGEMEAYAEKVGVGPDCRFPGSIHDREVLRGYYSMADLFLFPSSYDTFGLVVREAAACGTASLLARDSCAAEGALDGENSFLVEETGQSVYECLSQVGHDRERLARTGQRAQETMYVSWEDSVARARERYELVIERHRAGDTSRRFELSDEFFNIMDSLCEKVAWARRQQEKVVNLNRDLKEMVRDKWHNRRYF